MTDLNMDNEIKYSFIIPAYNIQAYISECIESVLRQKTNDFEIVIVDDGSTDKTADIADEYAKKYKNIKVIHQTNKGNAAAKNRGMREASGTWILFVDGDDILCDDCIAHIEKKIEDMREDDILIFNYSYLYEDESVVPEIGFDELAMKCNHEKYKYLLMPTILWGKVFSRRFLLGNKIILPEGKIYEDLAVLFIWLPLVNRIYSVNESLYLYRQHNQSTTKNKDIDKMMNILDAIEHQYICLNNNGSYDSLRQRFEAYAITHIIAEFVPEISVLKNGKKYADQCMSYMKVRFPKYTHNPYIRKMSIRNRLYIGLCIRKMWMPLKMIVLLKKFMKRILLNNRLHIIHDAYKKRASRLDG